MSNSLKLATLDQPQPKANDLRPCFALAFDGLKNHPVICDLIMARSDKYLQAHGFYQQHNNGRSAYVDGLQQAIDLLLTLVQALYDTKGDMRYSDDYLKRIDDSFANTVDAIYLMLEMASYE